MLDPLEFSQWLDVNKHFIRDFMLPLGVTPASITLLATGVAVWKKLQNKYGLIAASVCAVCMFITFPIYFQEANAVLAVGSMTATEIANEFAQWQQVHWIRVSAAIIACYCMVRAGYVKSS